VSYKDPFFISAGGVFVLGEGEGSNAKGEGAVRLERSGIGFVGGRLSVIAKRQ